MTLKGCYPNYGKELNLLISSISNLLFVNDASSLPLEEFLVDTSRKSQHSAVLLIWSLDARLADFKKIANHSQISKCKRLLAEFRAIYLEDRSANLKRSNSIKDAAKLIPNLFVAVGCAIGSSLSPESFVDVKRLLAEREAINRRRSLVLASSSAIELSIDNFPLKSIVDKARQRLSLHIPDSRQSLLQFMHNLADISSRLCSVPRNGRQKALEAELNLLNSTLSRGICLPLWCKSDDKQSRHQVVVRIPAKEAVVLNSAERAPFMLLIEVLNGVNDYEYFNETVKEECKGFTFTDTNSTTSTVTSEQNQEIVLPTDTEIDRLQPSDSMTFDDYSERMRTAAIMLAQLNTQARRRDIGHKLTTINAIKKRIMNEMEHLERKSADSSARGFIRGDYILPETLILLKEDPSAVAFQEEWSEKVQRVKSSSSYGQNPNWQLLSVIVKAGADLRQEQLALQLISEMCAIWNECKVSCWVLPYKVLAVNESSGVIETVLDAISVHSIKKNAYISKLNKPGMSYTLKEYFVTKFGSEDSEEFINARRCFTQSLAGYCLVTFILQVKDRHNGNILIDREGHMIHIDFGFMLSNSPGQVGFESAPFKLSLEYCDLLGGLESPEFLEFQRLLLDGFLALRKHSDRLLPLAEILSKASNLPCFQSGDSSVQQLRERFFLSLTEDQITELLGKLVYSSLSSLFTRLYDTYQYYSNGIL